MGRSLVCRSFSSVTSRTTLLRNIKPVASVGLVRFNSTITTAAVEAIVKAATTESSPVITTPTFVEPTAIEASGPLALGDFANLDLCHYTPVGALEKVLELTAVYTGLPWWGNDRGRHLSYPYVDATHHDQNK